MQRLPCLRLEDADRLPDADEIIELFLFVRRDLAPAVLRREAVHVPPVGLAELKLQNVLGRLA